jgi:hypothetical protein
MDKTQPTMTGGCQCGAVRRRAVRRLLQGADDALRVDKRRNRQLPKLVRGRTARLRWIELLAPGRLPDLRTHQTGSATRVIVSRQHPDRDAHQA